jgi:UDP-glucose 4-epimerase
MSEKGLRVAVTGPTGDIGFALIRALEEVDEVASVVGLARRPFDATEHGLTKFTYLQGDITDSSALSALVEGADVVVHLAFLIFGSPDDTRKINIEGSTNVFRQALDADVDRLVYASSVAAYGYYEDHPDLLTEDVPPRGTDDHYYSAQKAELEHLLAEMTAGRDTETYVFRPCIVAGPTALSLIEKIPYVQMVDRLPERARRFIGSLPKLRPVIPDPGVPFQLVHENDVAQALVLAILGRGEPGVYNLAAEGDLTLTELAHTLGWYSVPLPELALLATVKVVSTMPLLPSSARWVNALKVPMLMDCNKARLKLGWEPQHDCLETLADTITAARDKGLLPWPDRVE